MAKPKRMYIFREDGVRTYPNAKDADPNEIGHALWDLAQQTNGRLDAEHAVLAARSRAHALHPFLTWDDKIAGHRWRLEEMRGIIRSVVLVTEDENGKPEQRRGWLSVEDKEGISYHDIEKVLNSQDLQLAVMRKALRDLEAWEMRYQELSDICELVKTARSRLETRLAAHAGAPA